MTTATADLLTWHHVHAWAQSLPEDWTARPGSCVACPIAQYLNDISSGAWSVGKIDAIPVGVVDVRERITMPHWIAQFISSVDVHRVPITKARLLVLLERCKPESEAQQ